MKRRKLLSCTSVPVRDERGTMRLLAHGTVSSGTCGSQDPVSQAEECASTCVGLAQLQRTDDISAKDAVICYLMLFRMDHLGESDELLRGPVFQARSHLALSHLL